MPMEMRTWQVSVLCNDCNTTSTGITYHILGHKCIAKDNEGAMTCGSYNTVVVDGPIDTATGKAPAGVAVMVPAGGGAAGAAADTAAADAGTGAGVGTGAGAFEETGSNGGDVDAEGEEAWETCDEDEVEDEDEVGDNGGVAGANTQAATEQVLCKSIVMATGLTKPNVPASVIGIEHAIGYEDLPETGRCGALT